MSLPVFSGALGQVVPTAVGPAMLPPGGRAKSADEWAALLEKAFADRERCCGLLALAKEALSAHPGEALILCLAATAALFEERPAEALIFLKRYFKRYVAGETYHLLRALALGQRNQFAPARVILKRHGLDSAYSAMRAFPGGSSRADWLLPRLRSILDPGERSGGYHPAVRHAVEGSHKRIGEAQLGSRRRIAPPAPANIPQPAAPTGLPLIEIDIPLATEVELSLPIVAMKKPPEADGGWYLLREQFARLGLVQGFDELLALPHLHQLKM